MIPFSAGHWTVIGKTRSGKTYATKKSLAAVKCGVLFFNVQLEDMPRGFIKADGDNEIEQIREALRAGKKINYVPSVNKAIRENELDYIIQSFYDGSEHDFFLAVDECHLFGRQATDSMIQIATTGLRFGLKGVFLSQRMQNIDKTLVTQSTNYVWFETNLESQYFRAKGIPIDEIDRRLESMPKIMGPDGQHHSYAYCLFDGRNVEGAFKVK